MTSKNLWGDLSELKTVRTPKDILVEQAEYLTKATNGVLVGTVEASSEPSYDFGYNLDIEIPSLNKYSYTLLKILHDISLYPLSLKVRVLDVTARCADEEEFVATIGEVLSSDKVKNVLAQLLSQAK